MAIDERWPARHDELAHLMMRGTHAWSEAPRDRTHEGGAEPTPALGPGAHDWPATGSARPDLALGGGRAEHRRGGAQTPLRYRHRPPVASALASLEWDSADRKERGRAVGRCAQVRPPGTDHARTDLPDHRAGLRDPGGLRPSHQPVERPGTGRRDHASRDRRPHLSTARWEGTQKRWTSSPT